MIGKLKGIIESVMEDALLIDVGGVCYYVFASAATLRQLPREGEATTLWIETHVREDHIHLYGFTTEAEKKAFLLLNKVSGVGAKMALSILSAATPSQLATAIAAEDAAPFKAASGVGPKLAKRILVDLKDKFTLFDDGTGLQLSGAAGAALASEGQAKPSAASGGHPAVGDAISALVNLGYSRSDAYSAVSRAASGQEDAGVSELIRAGLKELGGV